MTSGQDGGKLNFAKTIIPDKTMDYFLKVLIVFVILCKFAIACLLVMFTAWEIGTVFQEMFESSLGVALKNLIWLLLACSFSFELAIQFAENILGPHGDILKRIADTACVAVPGALVLLVAIPVTVVLAMDSLSQHQDYVILYVFIALAMLFLMYKIVFRWCKGKPFLSGACLMVLALSFYLLVFAFVFALMAAIVVFCLYIGIKLLSRIRFAIHI